MEKGRISNSGRRRTGCGYERMVWKKVKVTFTMRFMRNGEILSTYHIDKLGLSMPDRMKLRVSVSPGGLNEIGQSFLCAPNMDALTWERRGAWTVYPKDHIDGIREPPIASAEAACLVRNRKLPGKMRCRIGF